MHYGLIFPCAKQRNTIQQQHIAGANLIKCILKLHKILKEYITEKMSYLVFEDTLRYKSPE